MSEDEPDRGKGGLGGRLADRYRYRPMGAAYQGAMEAVFAIVGSTAAGYWADSYFETSPWCLIAGATIGFSAFVLRLYRLGSDLDQPQGVEAPPGGTADGSRTSPADPEADPETDPEEDREDGTR